MYVKGMEEISSKKLKRLDKKKKKMIAMLEISKLNDADKKHMNTLNEIGDQSELSTSEDEPDRKKIKTENEIEITLVDDKKSDILKNNNNTAEPLNESRMSRTGKTYLEGEEYKKLKKELRERTRKLRNIPFLRLKQVGEEAQLSVAPENRTPLFLSDIQHLLLFAQLGNHSPYTPQRWSHIEKYSRLSQTIVLVIENLSLYNYENHESEFTNINSIFKHKLEIVTPSVYKGDLVEEIAAVPLTSTQKGKLLKEYGSFESALNSSKVFSMLKAVFPVQERVKQLNEQNLELPGQDKFPRTHLLLSAWQLVQENYPLPLKGSLASKYADYVLTKDRYDEVTPSSPMYAIDCEMCRTTLGEHELTRISVVDEKHEVIYESFVKPYNRITDYLTQFSGITPAMLKNVTKRLEHVQQDLRELLPPDAILVGQSLNSDFNALRMMHPYVIDTSVIFNITGERMRKTKLKILTREFLDEVIQNGEHGHCSVEDSISSLKLVQLKLLNSIEFGDAVLSGQKGCLREYRNMKENYYGSSLLHHVTKIDKTAAVFSLDDVLKKYNKYIHQGDQNNTKITCFIGKNNKAVVKATCKKSLEYNLSVAHVKLDENDLSSENIVNTCKTVDKWVKNLWMNMAWNGMAVIVFGGQTGGNGACFIQVKKPTV